MDPRQLEVAELRKQMRLGLDIVMAHRITKGLSLDREKVTAVRDLLEQRVMMAMESIDTQSMPPGWSWQKAAESISVQIALEIVHSQKNEPREA